MATNNKELDEALKPTIKAGLEFEFERLDSDKSIKTTYLIVDKNFNKLSVFLKGLIDYIDELAESIKLENIVSDVINEINNNKTNILIKPNIDKNQSVIISGFIVTRDDKDIYNIRKQKGSWKTENLIVQIKDEVNGTILYPEIRTVEDYIEFYFVDGLPTNVKVMFV